MIGGAEQTGEAERGKNKTHRARFRKTERGEGVCFLWGNMSVM